MPPTQCTNISLGIDQSLTGTGVIICGADHNILHHEVIKSSKSDGDMYVRVRNICNRIMDIIEPYEIDRGCIEGIAMGARGMIGDLGGLQHVIVNRLFECADIDFVVVPPKTLKKQTTGSGNATKWDMFDALPTETQELFVKYYKFSKRTGKSITGNGFDVTDAYHLATYKDIK